MQPQAVTLRFFTEADLAEKARREKEHRERDELLFSFARWIEERTQPDGPFHVPRLTPETEARLIELLRKEQDEPRGSPSGQPPSTA